MFVVVIEIMHLYDNNMIVIIVKIAYNPVIMIYTLFVCLLLNGTSALFRPLVPRIVEIEHTNHVKNDLK